MKWYAKAVKQIVFILMFFRPNYTLKHLNAF